MHPHSCFSAVARRFFLCLALLLVVAPAIALDGKALTTFSREVWTTRDGLPHNQVNGITQTPEGYLWFATWEGLVRYNGQDFRTYGPEDIPAIQDNGLRSVTTGPGGHLVVATSRGGVSVLRGQTWSHYGKAEGLRQDETMSALEDRNGNLWIAHESEGLTRIDAKGSVRHFGLREGLASEICYTLIQDSSGVIWLGTGEGVVRIDGERVQAFGQSAGLPPGAVFSVAQSSEGEIFVGTEHGVYRGKGGRFSRLTADFPDEAVPSLRVDAKGGIWIGTVNRGLMRFSSRGLETVDTRHGLPNNRVASMFIDQEGSIWAGTNAGLVRFADTPFINYDSQLGLSDDYVRALLQTRDGDVLIGTSRGLDRWKNEKISHVGAEAGLTGDAILSLAEDRDGSLWIGLYSKGLIHWKDGRILSQKTMLGDLPASQVRALLVDRSDGSLWVGGSRGLAHLKGGSVVTYSRKDGLPRNFILSLFQAKNGRIWIGTANGLSYFEEGRITAVDISGMDGAQDIFGMHEDADGSLWFASDRGLLRWRDGQFRIIGRRQGLPVVTIFQVIADSYGNFWLTSNSGVIHIRRGDIDAVLSGKQADLKATQYAEADGMGSAQCNGGAGPAALRANDGSLWFATAKGVAVVQPDQLARYQLAPPPVVIEGVRVDGKRALSGGKIVLPPGTRKLELDYVSLTYRTPEQIEYRYLLEGYDDTWVDRDQLRNAQYTNLPPGSYRFKVAAGRGGKWSQEVATQVFQIEPRLYQRAWFLPLAGLLIAGFLYGLYRSRVRTLEARELELSGVVAERTSDLSRKNDQLEQLNQTIRQQSEAFELQARTDALTGLANRRSMEENLAIAFQEAFRQQQPLCFGLLDIDHFKRVNDSYSHDVGDEALRLVANVMMDVLGQEHASDWLDTTRVARWGGEEFALLFPGSDMASARASAERLRMAIAAADCSAFAPGLKLTVSIGIAERTGLSHQEKMISRADEKLYQAKHAGRNQVVV